MEIRNYNTSMRYRPFGKTGVLVSVLGYGAMRFPVVDGKIDRRKSFEMLETALDGGINYIDTAYPYNNGDSEVLIGEFMSADSQRRENAYIATKLPVWELKKKGDQDPLFETQLRRLQSESCDFYLLHAISKNFWDIIKNTGTLEWLDQLKKNGRIRFAGFSFHDDYPLFEEVIDAYDWDFCQIQYNYAQEDVQAGVRGLKYAHSKGIGVSIMEPLFGGFLTGLQMPPGACRLFEENGIDPVAGALRWLWNQPEPAVVLSGMSEIHQVTDNLRTASSAEPGMLSDVEKSVLSQVCNYIREHVPIGCSKCGYCLQSCPVGVNIPMMFDLYNKHLLVDRKHTLQPALYNGRLPNEKASACIECGACLKHCPQKIDIPQWLKKVAAEFEPEVGL